MKKPLTTSTAGTTPVDRTSMLAGDLYRLVRQIPRGKVASYGGLARQLGISPRQVGRLLHHNPDSNLTPCHRVVMADGSIASGYAFGGPGAQRQLLEQEGVVFVKNRVAPTSFVGDEHK